MPLAFERILITIIYGDSLLYQTKGSLLDETMKAWKIEWTVELGNRKEMECMWVTMLKSFIKRHFIKAVAFFYFVQTYNNNKDIKIYIKSVFFSPGKIKG